MNRWGRYALVLVSLLFITGGAFNDGITSYKLALPFVILLYFALPSSNKNNLIISAIVLILMIVVSNNMAKSSLVFPVLGQKITLLNDLPVEIPYNNAPLHYDSSFYYGFPNADLRTHGQDYLPSGSTYYIKKIYWGSDWFENYWNLVMSDGNKEIVIVPWDLIDNKLAPPKPPNGEPNFCRNVTWEFCSEVQSRKWDTIADPMARPFRLMSNLMYYPLFPIYLSYLPEWFSKRI